MRVCSLLRNSILTVTGKIMDMLGSLLYIFGSSERHCKSSKETYIPLRPNQIDTLFVVVCINWATNRNWQTKLRDRRKVTDRNWQTKLLHRRKVTNRNRQTKLLDRRKVTNRNWQTKLLDRRKVTNRNWQTKLLDRRKVTNRNWQTKLLDRRKVTNRNWQTKLLDRRKVTNRNWQTKLLDRRKVTNRNWQTKLLDRRKVTDRNWQTKLLDRRKVTDRNWQTKLLDRRKVTNRNWQTKLLDRRKVTQLNNTSSAICYLLTYARRSQWSIGHQRPPAIALCSGLLLSFRTSWSPAISALLQCLASNCCEAGLSSSTPAGPGQGLACGAGCCLPEGVSDPAPLPPQYLLGHWFLSRSLPQIFISDFLLPLDFVDAPHTGVEECLDLSLHRLCCPPCLTSVKQD